MESESPFHADAWPDAIRLPAEITPGTRLTLGWDADADTKKNIAAWVEALPKLQQLSGVCAWTHVTPALFEALCTLRGLTHLQIKWSNLEKLDAIAGLRKLTHLHIGSSTRVESIEPLCEVGSLQYLAIENFKRITDFSPLARLTGLRELRIVGSMWTRQAVESVEPLATMTWLEELWVDTSNTKSIRPLERLQNLRFLAISGRRTVEEYAWLAGRLPRTRCQWFEPFLDLSAKGFGACRKCKQQTMVMVTGKGKPTLCRSCDEAKLARHVQQFEDLRAASAAELA
jgi:hypothetical protein